MDAAAWLHDRMTPAATAYVAAVAVLSLAGFATGQPVLTGVAALVTLPVSIVAVPVFYVLAGLLSLLPGANPSHASGSGYGGPVGAVVVSQTGAPASWYLVSLAVVGVVVLTLGALANVLLLDAVNRWRHAHA